MAHAAPPARPCEPAAGTAVIAPPRRPPDPSPRPSATLPQAVLSLDAVYRQLARPWPDDALAERYHAAYKRGADDLPAGEEPPERPITLLATASPRLISLAVAANVLHLLPTSRRDALDVAEELITTIDATATGSLHRCHLALQSDGESRGYDADEWLPLAYEQAADWLEHASLAADPPSLIEHAQHAGRFAALAIGSLDREAPTVPERSPTASRTCCSPACSPIPPPAPDQATSNPLSSPRSARRGLRGKEPRAGVRFPRRL